MRELFTGEVPTLNWELETGWAEQSSADYSTAAATAVQAELTRPTTTTTVPLRSEARDLFWIREGKEWKPKLSYRPGIASWNTVEGASEWVLANDIRKEGRHCY